MDILNCVGLRFVTHIWSAERDYVARSAVVIHNIRDKAAIIACNQRDTELVLQWWHMSEWLRRPAARKRQA